MSFKKYYENYSASLPNFKSKYIGKFPHIKNQQITFVPIIRKNDIDIPLTDVKYGFLDINDAKKKLQKYINKDQSTIGYIQVMAGDTILDFLSGDYHEEIS